MDTQEEGPAPAAAYPVRIDVQAATESRNRLTTAFRFFLSIPHLILVGGPAAAIATIGWNAEEHNWSIGSGTGLLGAVACLAAVIAWFAILLTGRHLDGLWKLTAYYLRWRVHAIAYMTLLRDEYPPFGDDAYPIDLVITAPTEPRDRLTVAVRLLLALPHLFVLWLLGVAWAVTTAVAWIVILLTGRYPETMYGFAIGVLAWGVRVEAYILLMRDEYPPFTLRVNA